MRDIFSEGLLYLDLLELYGSSYAVAELCGVAQSNVFRGANACAKLLNLGLSKDRRSGTYSVSRNQDVQRDLRRLNQRLRARENGQLRAVAPDHWLPVLSGRDAGLLRSLPIRWGNPLESLESLEQGLLDLVVLPSWQLQAHIPWPPRARRVDLYVPHPPFVATELSPIALRLCTLATHPLQQTPGRDPQEFSLAVTADLPDPSRHWQGAITAWPSGRLNRQEELSAALEEEPELVVLVPDPDLEALQGQLQPLETILPLPAWMLLVSLPALVTEPLHQQLTGLLRTGMLHSRNPQPNPLASVHPLLQNPPTEARGAS